MSRNSSFFRNFGKKRTKNVAHKFQRRMAAVEQLEKRELFAIDFRSFDGTGNNLANPDWGSAGEDFLRIAPADYADGISAAAGADRPSAREISNIVSAQPADTPTSSTGLSAMAYAWGQFIDHDIDLTEADVNGESLDISVPTGDPFFDPNGTGTETMPITRSQYDPATGQTTPREQFNSITSFIDGSMIYGNSEAEAMSLRTLEGGHMRTSDGELLPIENGMFLTGDIRANENPDLTSLQTLFVREHNRIADDLASTRPNWSDERLFQEARRIVVGELQAITYNEFLPALLGPNAIRPYHGYNPNVNATISNEFATAAYRFGHSMVGTDVEFLDNNGEELRDEVELRDAFFNPTIIQENGIDGILKYLASDKSQEIDPYVVDDLRNFLFGPPGSGGLDLASMNIQRGRDHGLTDYNSMREAYGLPRVTEFSQITSDPNLQSALEDAYGSVDNIDVWVGGLAEDHVRGGSVGPLFQRIIADQFTRLRDGDRYYYENDLRGPALSMVKNTSLADVIARNTDTTNLQNNVFVFKTAVSGRVYEDTNDNGRPERGEGPLVGVTVNLVNEDGETVATTQTARNGVYRFREVGLGTFTVQLDVPDDIASITNDTAVTKGGEVRRVDLAVTPEVVDAMMAVIGGGGQQRPGPKDPQPRDPQPRDPNPQGPTAPGPINANPGKPVDNNGGTDTDNDDSTDPPIVVPPGPAAPQPGPGTNNQGPQGPLPPQPPAGNGDNNNNGGNQELVPPPAPRPRR